MEQIQDILSRQDFLGAEIERYIRNYRKDPENRKTKSYLQERIKIIEAYWTEFDENHKTLIPHKQDYTEHLYFKQGYFEAVKRGYSTILDEFQQRLNKLLETERTTSEGNLRKPDADAETDNAGPSFMLENDKGGNEIEKTPPNSPQLDDDSKRVRFSFGYVPPFQVKENRENKDVLQLVRRQKVAMKALSHNLQEIKSKPDELITKTYCELKLQAINHYWSDIFKYNSEIWAMTGDPEPFGYQLDYYLEMEDWVHETITKLQQILETHKSELSSVRAHIKLPKVTLPTFSGDYLKWTQFRELYVQMIHSQPLSNSEKMYYLNGNVTGEAKALIQHLPVSEHNYDTAWKILNNRYNNQRLLITALLNKMLSQPTLMVESAAAIKSLHDVTKECVLGIKNLGINVADWDALLLHLIVKKLDKSTHNLFEQSLESPKEIPQFEGFLEFLETRFQSLEALGPNKRQPVERRFLMKPSSLVMTNKAQQKSNCKLCDKEHAIYYCSRFLKMSPTERKKQANKLRLCSNCLKEGHTPSQCASRGCTKCSNKHNSLLHVDTPNHQVNKSVSNIKQVQQPPQADRENGAINLAAHAKEDSKSSYVFLATALIQVLDSTGKPMVCRAILDSGSQLNFITDRLFKQLKLPVARGDLNVTGIGNCNVKLNKRANIQIASKCTAYNTQIEAFVINEIATNQPNKLIDIEAWPIPCNIKLADPDFNHPRRIDLLIGAEFFPELLSTGQIKLDKGLPTLQNTLLGWIVLGKLTKGTTSQFPFCGISSADQALEDQVRRFWEVEEVNKPSTNMTLSERECETHFQNTTKRDSTGRFTVKLPMRVNPTELGTSKDQALRRFFSLERRLNANPELKH